MKTETEATSIQISIEVAAPVERAFRFFTAEIGAWWPKDHHILQAELAEMVFEPQVGGHIYDRGVDGSECRWARVLAYEPPSRCVFSWNLNTQWTIEVDPARCSEVEVRFVAEGPDRTRVELEHRHLDRHGDGWKEFRDALGSLEGWGMELRVYAEALGSA